MTFTESAALRLPHVKVLWSGGFDSTFLVLDLLRTGFRVHPVVLVDSPEWQKRQREAAARHRIRWALPREYAGRLGREEVLDWPEWVDRFEVLDQAAQHRYPEGYSSQIPMLAAAAKLTGPVLSGYLEDDGAVRRGDVTMLLEAGIGCPMISLTKPQLLARAARHGYGPLLDLTWSCEGASALVGPCGECDPCLQRLLPAAPLTI